MHIIPFGFISEDAQVRYTTVPSLMISIIDCIKALSGKDQHDAAQDFRRICSRFPEFEGKYSYHKFPGERQRDTPVGNLETVLMIMQHVPGPIAQKYREGAARVLREHIANDPSNPLHGIAREEPAPTVQQPEVSSPYSDIAGDREVDVINIKATAERMGMDQSCPFYEEYQRHMTEVIKENMSEMVSLEMKLAKNRANNRITIEKVNNDVEKEKAKLEKLRCIREQKLTNLEILNAEMEYTAKRLEQEKRSKENQEMRALHAVKVEQMKLDAVRLKKERSEMRSANASSAPLALGEKRKRGRPPINRNIPTVAIPTAPDVPVVDDLAAIVQSVSTDEHAED